MRIHIVRAKPHGILAHAAAAAIVLRRDVIADHAAGFANIQLVRPIAIVHELVLREAPPIHTCLNFFRHARVVCEEPQESFLVNFVLLDDSLPRGVVAIGVLVVHADIICAKRPVIVGVCLAVRHGLMVAEDVIPLRR